MNHVFFMLPKLHGVLKTDCLECVLSRAEVIPDVFMQLKTSGFVQMMSHRCRAHADACLSFGLLAVTVTVTDESFLHSGTKPDRECVWT